MSDKQTRASTPMARRPTIALMNGLALFDAVKLYVDVPIFRRSNGPMAS
jgi:hypothetical protein